MNRRWNREARHRGERESHAARQPPLGRIEAVRRIRIDRDHGVRRMRAHQIDHDRGVARVDFGAFEVVHDFEALQEAWRITLPRTSWSRGRGPFGLRDHGDDAHSILSSHVERSKEDAVAELTVGLYVQDVIRCIGNEVRA